MLAGLTSNITYCEINSRNLFEAQVYSGLLPNVSGDRINEFGYISMANETINQDYYTKYFLPIFLNSRYLISQREKNQIIR